MVNILLEGYRIGEPWLYADLKYYLLPSHQVTVVALSFRDSRVHEHGEWCTLYDLEAGSEMKKISAGLAAYGIPREQIAVIDYFSDTRETATEKILNADVLYFTGGVPDRMMERAREMGIVDALKRHRGIVMGYSAGALVQLSEYHLSPDHDYPEFCYCEGLSYLDGFYLEVHYTGEEAQRAAIRRVLAERGKTVYAFLPMRGALIAENGNVRRLGDVECFGIEEK